MKKYVMWTLDKITNKGFFGCFILYSSLTFYLILNVDDLQERKVKKF